MEIWKFKVQNSNKSIQTAADLSISSVQLCNALWETLQQAVQLLQKILFATKFNIFSSQSIKQSISEWVNSVSQSVSQPSASKPANQPNKLQQFSHECTSVHIGKLNLSYKNTVPCSSRNLTRSTWPSCAASIRGVDEPCSMEAPERWKINVIIYFNKKKGITPHLGVWFDKTVVSGEETALYLLEEEMQLHLENLHNKPSSRLSPESLLFVHECQLLKHNTQSKMLQNHMHIIHL